jgi:hypothetical protein
MLIVQQQMWFTLYFVNIVTNLYIILYIHTHIYIYIQTHTYIYIHTYTYIYIHITELLRKMRRKISIYVQCVEKSTKSANRK